MNENRHGRALDKGGFPSSLPYSDMNSIKRSQMVSTDSSLHVLDFNLFQIMIQFIVGFQFSTLLQLVGVQHFESTLVPLNHKINISFVEENKNH